MNAEAHAVSTPNRTALLFAAAMIAVTLSISIGAAPQSPAVAKLLAEARQALGGDASRARIRSFKITGTIKTSNRLQSGSFEIVCALPDRFMQVDQRAVISAGEMVSEPSRGPSVHREATRLGFNGDRLIFQPHVVIPGSRRNTNLVLTQAQLAGALKAARNGFASLTLGLFAEGFAGVPLQFTEETGPGSENSVQVTGPDVAGTLIFNRQTRLPERFGRMRYDDYRDVGGRKVPFHISDNFTEWIVREFLVNVDVPEKVFKPTYFY